MVKQFCVEVTSHDGELIFLWNGSRIPIQNRDEYPGSLKKIDSPNLETGEYESHAKAPALLLTYYFDFFIENPHSSSQPELGIQLKVDAVVSMDIMASSLTNLPCYFQVLMTD